MLLHDKRIFATLLVRSLIFHRQTGENPSQPAGANEGEVQGESIQPTGQ